MISPIPPSPGSKKPNDKTSERDQPSLQPTNLGDFLRRGRELGNALLQLPHPTHLQMATAPIGPTLDTICDPTRPKEIFSKELEDGFIIVRGFPQENNPTEIYFFDKSFTEGISIDLNTRECITMSPTREPMIRPAEQGERDIFRDIIDKELNVDGPARLARSKALYYLGET